jgi:hypothetical protein
MHFQSPIATENDGSTIVSTFYQTPEKPTVDCGVSVASFPFPTVHIEPAPPMLLPMMLPSKTTVKPAFDCCVPYFPSNLFDQSPSIQLAPAKVLPSIQPPSNDPPSIELFHPISPPATIFLSVDDLNDSANTNPELPTRLH